MNQYENKGEQPPPYPAPTYGGYQQQPPQPAQQMNYGTPPPGQQPYAAPHQYPQQYPPQGGYPSQQYPSQQYPSQQYPPQQPMMYGQQPPYGGQHQQPRKDKDGLLAALLGCIACCCCLDCLF